MPVVRKKKPIEREKISVQFPGPLIERIREVAEAGNISVSAVIRAGMREFLARHEASHATLREPDEWR